MISRRAMAVFAASVLAWPLTAAAETIRLSVDGRERSAELHIPRQAGPLPLLLVLHGTYGSGAKMRRALGFDAQADRLGFIVAYPDAFDGLRWNDGRGTLASSTAGVDDVGFLVTLVDQLARRLPVDRRRVFVTGASNGGMMTWRLACETSGVFAGVAPVIASLPAPIADRCRPAAPIRVLAINGGADPFIPLQGGTVCAGVSKRWCEGGQVISLEASLAILARANRCGPRRDQELPPRVADGTSVTAIRHAGCDVTGYVVRNGGHTWPPHRGQLRASGQPTGNLDATSVIAEAFFASR